MAQAGCNFENATGRVAANIITTAKDELALGDDAMLGSYQVILKRSGRFHGSGSFRVEEYKKPEYEVTIATAKDQVKLGDQMAVKINGRYYFGAPVVGAKVTYEVYVRSMKSLAWPLVVRMQPRSRSSTTTRATATSTRPTIRPSSL